jgi:methylated-DNA-[protein]-cysteine S-methyltransferase
MSFPGASQAVGNAMAANPLQILVPCHRVIRSDGSMGQYSRGKKNSVKNWLLEHEGLKVVNRKVVALNIN